jgi:hypothetical protein
MKKWLIALGIFLLGLAIAILGRDGRALRKTEHDAAVLLGSKIKKEQLKAEHLNKKAEKQKAGAKLAAEATLAKLEKISVKDTPMDDLLSAFESERVRQSKPG